MEQTMNKTILLVDDDPDYLNQMELMIRKFGFDVVKAESKKEALMILESFKPDLAMFDLMMETQDAGFVLAYKCKQLYPDVPVAIATSVTGDTGIKFEMDRQASHSWVKADIFMEKGIRPDQLHREISRLLKL